MTARRPPKASTLTAPERALSSCPSSSLACIRSAWNVRVAGCFPGSRVLTARATSSASSRVRSIGRSRLAATMACATRRAKRSSPESGDHLANLVDARTSEPRGHRLTACRVHAHIERTVGPEAEAARRIVELRRGDTEVEQNTPASAAARVSRHERPDVGKRRMHERKPHFAGEAPAAGRDGRRVLVDREHAPLATQGLEEKCRMTTAPERRINIVTIRLWGQRPERLICEHRDVLDHTPDSYNDSESNSDG